MLYPLSYEGGGPVGIVDENLSEVDPGCFGRLILAVRGWFSVPGSGFRVRGDSLSPCASRARRWQAEV